MHSNEDFMREITSTPSHDYAWIYYGTVMIAREGVYTLCSTSDDGSILIVDDKKLVDNDGLHGAQQRCAATQLSTGKHTVAQSRAFRQEAEPIRQRHMRAQIRRE